MYVVYTHTMPLSLGGHQEKLQKMQAQLKLLTQLQEEKAKLEAKKDKILDSQIAALPTPPPLTTACSLPQHESHLSVSDLLT